jgi:hypothetical protein
MVAEQAIPQISHEHIEELEKLATIAHRDYRRRNQNELADVLATPINSSSRPP